MKSPSIVSAAFIVLFTATCVSAVEPDFTVTPFAGASSVGSADGSGADARFNLPQGILLDPAGNLFVADKGNRTIRKITPGGVVSTYSGVVGISGMLDGPVATARFNAPTGLAQDHAGNLYVADNITIRKITPDGTVSSLAGGPFFPDASPAPLFSGTSSLAVDATGNIYIAAYIRNGNYGLARIAPDGSNSTLYDGANDWPAGVALDSTGKIFYTTASNGNAEGVSILSSDNTPTRFVGGGTFGSADGTGANATFSTPAGLKFANDGNLYVADAGNNEIRIVTPAGGVSTLAGTTPVPNAPGFLSQGGMVDGPKSVARFWGPSDIAIDAMKNVFVADRLNNAIRKVTPAGDVSTIAGLYPASAGNINGTGNSARFNDPRGVAVGPAGELYVADAGNRAIRKVSSTGTVSLFANTGDVPLWTTVGATGNVYVSEGNGAVEKITPAGTVSALAGPFTSAAGLAVDSSDNVFVADTLANVIHKIAPDGSVSVLSLTAGGGSSNPVLLRSPLGLALDAAGNLYVVNQGNQAPIQNGGGYLAYISKISPAGVTSVIAGLPDGWVVVLGAPIEPKDPQMALTVATPRGITVDPAGNIYVTAGSTESGSSEQQLFRITPSGSVTTLPLRGADGRDDELFGSLTGVAADQLGSLYVSDNAANFNRISKITPSSTPSGTLPAITTQPQSQTVATGNSVQFSVGATGNPAPTYQWYFNQTAISGATGSSYSLANVQARDAGDYSVVVANTSGQVTSGKATLTLGTATPVNTPAFVAQTTARTVATGATTTFSVSVGGSSVSSYQWQMSSNSGSTWTNVTDGAPYSGATTSVLSITGATAAMNGYQYRCIAGSAAGNTTSNAATLSINNDPALVYPVAIARDHSGNLLVADASANVIRMVTPGGAVSIFAGAVGNAGSADGTGSAARFNQPGGLALDASGTLFVADTGNALIRKITSTGVVTTLAGDATARGNVDGNGSAARFNHPVGLAIDSAGILYVADTFTDTVRKITPGGAVSTLAGTNALTGSADGSGAAARFNNPSGVAVDANGAVFVADTGNNTIRKISADGTVTTLAGLPGVAGTTDGTGSAAFFSQPTNLAIDSTGNLYVADTGNALIRRVTSSGTVALLAGVPGIAGLADGVGLDALFDQPHGLVLDGNGNLLVADTGNAALRKIASDATVTTLAVTPASTAPVPSTPATPTTPTGTSSSSGTSSPASNGGGGGGSIGAWWGIFLLSLGAARVIFARNSKS